MLVFVLEAGVGALARLYEEQVGPELKMNLNRTFLENYAVRRRETSAIDQMQIEVSSSESREIETTEIFRQFIKFTSFIYPYLSANKLRNVILKASSSIDPSL